ncbi:MAG: hypothetical protein LC105_09600 [Chitinophagales bacterium]|nr:hypothetical protein [Chitinophagales bacterium]MCZ2394099.1 hypothetical protein [Chitinophagales bacterium]
MRHLVTIFVLMLYSTLMTKAQTSYSGKIEVGYQHYLFRTLTVEPGHGWKGYNLDKEQNAYNITTSQGITFATRKLFAGIGIGYHNFKGTDGISIFGDFEYLPLKNKITPILNLRLGYNHIWNQYEGGTGTMLTELGLGLNYKINENFGIYLKSGIFISQQAFLIPITLGFRF